MSSSTGWRGQAKRSESIKTVGGGLESVTRCSVTASAAIDRPHDSSGRMTRQAAAEIARHRLPPTR
jgi:hypothetical protein